MLKQRVNIQNLFRKLNFKPHPGQERLFEAQERFLVWMCGRRWGKSLAAARWGETMLLLPNTRGWVVSKTYDLTKKVTREIYRDMVMTLNYQPSKCVLSGPIIMEFPWGSTVEGKTCDHPESLLGEGLDWLVFDEFAKCPASIWDFYLRPTLTDRNGKALFISTPNGFNWGYDMYLRGGNPGYPEWKSYTSPTWENPFLNHQDIEEAKLTLSEVAFAQEYAAQFTMFAGQVYKEFDTNIHVIDDMPLIKQGEWTLYRTLDFGYTDPNVCLFCCASPDGVIYVLEEIYKQGITAEAFGNEINAVSAGYEAQGLKFEYTTCDPSGAAWRAALRELDIPTLAVKSSVVEGLEKVRQYLKIKDKRSQLYFLRNCHNTIKDFSLYAYNENRTSEEPAHPNSHGPDATRYLISWLAKGRLRQYSGLYV